MTEGHRNLPHALMGQIQESAQILSPPGKLGPGGKQSYPALEQRQLGLTEAPTTGLRAHKATGG